MKHQVAGAVPAGRRPRAPLIRRAAQGFREFGLQELLDELPRSQAQQLLHQVRDVRLLPTLLPSLGESLAWWYLGPGPPAGSS